MKPVSLFPVFLSAALCAGASAASKETAAPPSPAGGKTKSETIRQFPKLLPGKSIRLIKEKDPLTGQMVLKSDHPAIGSAEDLKSFEAREWALKKKTCGALSEAFCAELESGASFGDEMVDVLVRMKTPEVKYLDKTRHALEACRTQSFGLLGQAPLADLGETLLRYGATAELDEGPQKFQGRSRLSRKTLLQLSGDPNVASVTLYTEQKPLQSGGGSPPYSSLATSAYNPASAMPADSKGQGIRIATFESGLKQSFLTCAGLNPVDYFAAVLTDHSHRTFRAMAYAAPNASFYHRGSLIYDSQGSQDYIVNHGLNTVSMSLGRHSNEVPHPPTYAEFLVMDDFAYRYPFPTFNNPTGNAGTSFPVNWLCYNAISVGNVRHVNQSTYEVSTCTQAKNPPPVYGSCISGSGSPCAGDREMPHVVAPGRSPSTAAMVDPCLTNITCGTSYSAPINSGIAACVMSAKSGSWNSWPEKTRVALLATAQNVSGGEWSPYTDGFDGAGVISGSAAVAYAKAAVEVGSDNGAVEHGIAAGSLYASNQGYAIYFNIKVPAVKPAGKHLRVVLTWNSSPSLNQAANALSDLDLTVENASGGYLGGSSSWDNNIEIVDIASSSLTAGETVKARLNPFTMRFAPGARTDFTYYSIGWTWVKDHAD